jgi:hypothetical protein
MILRILTDTNFFDIELKEKVNKDILIVALDNMSTLMLETKDNTTIFINTVNIVSLEVFDTPPISK